MAVVSRAIIRAITIGLCPDSNFSGVRHTTITYDTYNAEEGDETKLQSQTHSIVKICQESSFVFRQSLKDEPNIFGQVLGRTG